MPNILAFGEIGDCARRLENAIYALALR